MDGELRAYLEAMEGRLSTMEGRLSAELGKVRAAVMERLDRVQNAVTLIRDDVATNFGTADHVRRANDNTREEVRALGELQATMMRQIQRLQSDVRALKGE